MDAKLTIFAIGICVVLVTVLSPGRGDGLITINGDLVHIIDNCTVGDSSTCPDGKCCTKKDLSYPAGHVGDEPLYELACKPLRQQGEFCYFSVPENFCPCANKCVSNGFYGSCL